MTETTEDWCQPGATAYVLSWNFYSERPYRDPFDPDRLMREKVTIARTTKTQAVLDDGRKFKINGPQVKGWNYILVGPNDPRAALAVSSVEALKALDFASKACRLWDRMPSVEAARAVIAALEAWIAHQEEGQ